MRNLTSRFAFLLSLIGIFLITFNVVVVINTLKIQNK